MVDRGGGYIEASLLDGKGTGVCSYRARSFGDDVEFETFVGVSGDGPVTGFLHDSEPLDIDGATAHFTG